MACAHCGVPHACALQHLPEGLASCSSKEPLRPRPCFLQVPVAKQIDAMTGKVMDPLKVEKSWLRELSWANKHKTHELVVPKCYCPRYYYRQIVSPHGINFGVCSQVESPKTSYFNYSHSRSSSNLNSSTPPSRLHLHPAGR